VAVDVGEPQLCPGWGRSLRAMTRMPGGQPARSSSPVNSATRAPGRCTPPASQAGVQAPAGTVATASATPAALTGNPTEYCSRRPCSQAVNSCVPPPESVRISARRPAGSCARASFVTAMWSAAVFEPALPGRSMMASASPVPSPPWPANAPSGWKPHVLFQVAAACALSNPHRFAWTCAGWRLACTGLSAGGGAVEPVLVDVVGDVADQAGVVHAERGW
jgi:hypothetical protein